MAGLTLPAPREHGRNGRRLPDVGPAPSVQFFVAREDDDALREIHGLALTGWSTARRRESAGTLSMISFGWAFSISSNSRTENGRALTRLTNSPPVSYPKYPGGAPKKRWSACSWPCTRSCRNAHTPSHPRRSTAPLPWPVPFFPDPGRSGKEQDPFRSRRSHGMLHARQPERRRLMMSVTRSMAGSCPLTR